MTFNHKEYIAKQNAKTIARNKPIKAFANFSGYSDVEPFEVVDVRTENKVVIRAMKAERAEGWKPEFVSGGFSAHCTNNDDQRNSWSISPDEDDAWLQSVGQKQKCAGNALTAVATT